MSEPMSGERWEKCRRWAQSGVGWHREDCREIAAEMDRLRAEVAKWKALADPDALRAENARLESEAEASLEKITALMAERNQAQAQRDHLQAALESECERNRQREEELLGRLAEAERFINGLVNYEPDPEDGPEEFMRWAKSFAGHYLEKHTAPPAAQPDAQPPTDSDPKEG